MKDPGRLEDKQKKAIKDYCNTFMKKAVAKQREYEKHKAAKKKRAQETSSNTPIGSPKLDKVPNGDSKDTPQGPEEDTPMKDGDDKDDMSDLEAAFDVSDDEMPQSKESETPFTPLNPDGESLKRKRTGNGVDDEDAAQEDQVETPNKRQRSETPPSPPPPPPPPPPPAEETHTIEGFPVASPSQDGSKRKREEDLDNGYGEMGYIADGSPIKRARSTTPPPPLMSGTIP